MNSCRTGTDCCPGDQHAHQTICPSARESLFPVWKDIWVGGRFVLLCGQINLLSNNHVMSVCFFCFLWGLQPLWLYGETKVGLVRADWAHSGCRRKSFLSCYLFLFFWSKWMYGVDYCSSKKMICPAHRWRTHSQTVNEAEVHSRLFSKTDIFISTNVCNKCLRPAGPTLSISTISALNRVSCRVQMFKLQRWWERFHSASVRFVKEHTARFLTDRIGVLRRKFLVYSDGQWLWTAFTALTFVIWGFTLKALKAFR